MDKNKAHDEVEWWDPHIDIYSSLYSIFCTWEIKVGAYNDEKETILSHFCKRMRDKQLGRNFKNC